eukprot:scaffold65201_cov39-Phaeocystis_antarctica.AAC.1
MVSARNWITLARDRNRLNQRAECSGVHMVRAPAECLPGSSFCAKAPRVQVRPMPLPLTLTRDNSLEVAGATGILSALLAALLLVQVSRRRRTSTPDEPGGGRADEPEPAARR